MTLLSSERPANGIRKRLETCPACAGRGFVVNGNWLRAKREDAGVSQREMAERLHVSPSFVCDVEYNRRRASQRVIAAYEGLE